MDTPSHGFPAPRALEAVAAFVVHGPRRLVDRHMQGFVFEEYWLASKAWERHGLTTGAARSLVHNGFLTLDDLQGAHNLELATISRIGRKSLAVLYGLMGGEVPSNDGRRPGRQTGQVYGQPTWQRPARQGSARLVVSRILMAGFFWTTSTARVQIDFAQAIATVIDGIKRKLLVALPSQRAVRPRTDAPTTVWGRPG